MSRRLSMSSPRPWRALLLCLCLLPLTLLAGCEEETAPEPVIRPVRARVIEDRAAETVRTFPGASRAESESALAFRVGGQLSEVLVNIGDRVEAGQVIARLDPTDYESTRREAAAAVTQARSQQQVAQADYDRTRRLYAASNATAAQLEGARAQADSARASLATAQQRLASARRQVEYATLTAFAAGQIAEVLMDPGEVVGGGSPIAVLSTGEEVQVSVSIPESLIGRVQAGMEVEVRFDSVEQAYRGQVSEVGVRPTGASTTYPVVVALEQSEGLRPGMAAEVTITFEANEDEAGILVPPATVLGDQAGPYVYVFTAEGEGPAQDGAPGRTERRDVVVGDLSAAGLPVLSGLTEGDLLITAGMSLLSPDLEVTLQLERAQGAR